MVKSIKIRLENTKFKVEHLRETKEKLSKLCSADQKLSATTLEVTIGKRTYYFGEDEEQEESFFERYSEPCKYAYLAWCNREENLYFRLHYDRFSTYSSAVATVETANPSATKRLAEFLEGVAEFAIEEFPTGSESKKPTKVFIGHGRSAQWKDLRDHLRDMHDIDVVAYESGARAGHTIRDIVEEMADQSDMAFLVHTAEDDMADGKQQSRPNVVHETGLFQGKLGYTKAIVVLEKGCEEFSNLAGVQQIRFAKGNIRETFGDVLATIKRELGTGD